MSSINERRRAPGARAGRRSTTLTEYERRHPRQGPDADGRPYDPVRDVIDALALGDGSTAIGAEIDEVAHRDRSRSRTWEGFAWANHRFVLSDDAGQRA